jgi:hypothetical protein
MVFGNETKYDYGHSNKNMLETAVSTYLWILKIIFVNISTGGKDLQILNRFKFQDESDTDL